MDSITTSSPDSTWIVTASKRHETVEHIARTDRVVGVAMGKLCNGPPCARFKPSQIVMKYASEGRKNLEAEDVIDGMLDKATQPEP